MILINHVGRPIIPCQPSRSFWGMSNWLTSPGASACGGLVDCSPQD